MTRDEAYEKQRRERLQLERDNKKLIALLEQADKDSYVSAEKAAHLKTINKLTQENQHLKNLLEKYKDLYHSQVRITENHRAGESDYCVELDETKKELQEYKDLCTQLNTRIYSLTVAKDREILELKAQITALKEALGRAEANANIDGSNSSLPTSQTPIGKKKVIPNLRIKTGKKCGGQTGHKKHSLKPFLDSEVTDYENHTLEACPACGSESLTFLEKREKDVIDYEIKMIKKRHYYYIYQCDSCGRIVHSPIPPELKEPVQYGNNIQAAIVSLLDIGYVSINRTKKIIDGLIGNDISVSEGYISKLQKRASENLKEFTGSLANECRIQKTLHWDDTVIYISTNRACMRFYGNEKLALYKAHRKKDRSGIDEDGILGSLGSGTTVVHDHVSLNYNDDFSFRNAECSQHILRELQKVYEYTGHDWAKDLKELLSKVLHERNLLVAEGKEGFGEKYHDIMRKIDEILKRADLQFLESKGRYFEDDERKIITRLRNYKDSNFLWIRDFSVPPTNNVAERSLRCTKVKQKVSGQYQNLENARYFADIKSYIETCYRNEVPVFEAISRLMSGNPYTTSELLGKV